MNTGVFAEEDVPPEILAHEMKPTDKRSFIISCSTCPAVDGNPEDHVKLTLPEINDRAADAIGKPLENRHAGKSSKIGEVVAAAVDSHGRIWTKAAVDETIEAQRVLSHAREGKLKGVSWEMGHFREKDPERGLVIKKKKMRTLSVTGDPEYPEHTLIHYISDDHEHKKAMQRLYRINDDIEDMHSEVRKGRAVSTCRSKLFAVC